MTKLFLIFIGNIYVYIGMMESLHNELRALKSAVVSTTVCPYFIETNPEISKHLELRYTLNINA